MGPWQVYGVAVPVLDYFWICFYKTKKWTITLFKQRLFLISVSSSQTLFPPDKVRKRLQEQIYGLRCQQAISVMLQFNAKNKVFRIFHCNWGGGECRKQDWPKNLLCEGAPPLQFRQRGVYNSSVHWQDFIMQYYNFLPTVGSYVLEK